MTLLLTLLACAVRVEAPAAVPPADGLTPLSAYTRESLEGVELLWSPAFASDPELRARTHDAIEQDLRARSPDEAVANAGRRVAVAPRSPPMADLPSHGRGMGWHRSAAWLASHGLDAERQGVVEIYNATDYLERRAADPSVLVRTLRASSGLPEITTPVPLERYRSEWMGRFEILWSPAIDNDRERAQRVRAALLGDLDTIERVAPEATLARLQGTRIAVTTATVGIDGKERRGMSTHVSARWLTANGFDAAREGVVEISNADDYVEWRTEQPMSLLHELTHVLEYRADRKDLAVLRSAYDAAVASGKYEAVGHVLAAPGETRRAYALETMQEYGAELAEAYFGRNDFAPFVRAELEAFDPVGCAAVARLWGTNCGPQ
jgi:hypothetical protein